MGTGGKKTASINSEGVTTLLLTVAFLAIINIILFLPGILGIGSWIFLLLSITLVCVLVNFFKNPVRQFPSEDKDHVVVSSADGKIVAVEEVDEVEYFHDRRILVSTFMNIFDVHANWYPVEGIVRKVSHQEGHFHAADKPKSSLENERSLIVIETKDGQQVMIRQVAGLMARRIVTYPAVGDHCRIDQHLGFIKFGSRVDIYLPIGSLVCVKMNERVKADVTILAKLPS
ncbi:MAG: phosphatidylserine decarboxylase family protein [Bacteroidaceae bacterium]|nr:phosphatidylserine decarboxylase family protein [Bacteroidaceae bacterium]